jgi:endoglucanase
MASGGDNIAEINTSPPQEAYVLYGAVVGGPDLRDRYFDIRSDWPQTEVRHLALPDMKILIPSFDSLQ